METNTLDAPVAESAAAVVADSPAAGPAETTISPAGKRKRIIAGVVVGGVVVLGAAFGGGYAVGSSAGGGAASQGQFGPGSGTSPGGTQGTAPNGTTQGG